MQKQGRNIAWRLFEGKVADEIHIQCRGTGESGSDIARQTTRMYRAMEQQLLASGSSLAGVVFQTVFFRDIRNQFEPFQSACTQVFGGCPQPASMWIEQPPLDNAAGITISAIAIVPHSGNLKDGAHSEDSTCRLLDFGDQRMLYSGALYGYPGDAFRQTRTMFDAAAEVLAKHGMDFRDVVRTWIYLREMDRDYADFNRGRREFFKNQGVTLLPASTGISGAPLPEGADLALSFCAVRSEGHPVVASAMTTPTLNEAPSYGSDFSRGLRVAESNKVALYISGTASVDEEGRTAHVDDFAAQVERMLLNVAMLLEAQQASFADVLSAVTYVKHAQHAPILRKILKARRLEQLPNAVVHAAVCRPDLLCEMEAIAALPR